MSTNTGELNVKIDIDMSAFDKSIDTISDRLSKLKGSISAVSRIPSLDTAFDSINSAVKTLDTKTKSIDNPSDSKSSPSSLMNLSSNSGFFKNANVQRNTSLSHVGVKDKTMEKIAIEEANKILKKEAALLSL